MTQEELDKLLAGDMEDDVQEESQSVQTDTKSTQNYDPVPPTTDNKMVHQLEDVTRDSELNATELFDKLDLISQILTNAEEQVAQVSDIAKENIEAFTLLVEKFPHVEKFQALLEKNQQSEQLLEDIMTNAQMAQDEVMVMMDMMQFQDIHRQKIERVINVMRALSRYMSSLFEGRIEDEKRVGSAVYIHGDQTESDVVSTDDIENLINSIGKK